MATAALVSVCGTHHRAKAGLLCGISSALLTAVGYSILLRPSSFIPIDYINYPIYSLYSPFLVTLISVVDNHDSYW